MEEYRKTKNTQMQKGKRKLAQEIAEEVEEDTKKGRRD